MYKQRYSEEVPQHEVTYEEVHLGSLLVSPRAQQTWNPARSKKIAQDFVPQAVGTIVLNRRADGRMFIVDGQHRWHACLMAGVSTLIAEVHHGLTEQEEALLFLLKNRESKKPNSRQEYKVAVTAGVPLYVDTEQVLAAHLLKIGSSASPYTVGAANSVTGVTKNYGPEILDRVLTVAEQAWGRESATWDASLIGGLGMFLGKHGEKINDEALAKKLKAKGDAARWRAAVSSRCTGGGGGGGSRNIACYQLVVIEWNKKRSANRIEP